MIIAQHEFEGSCGMKCHHKLYIFALLVLASVIYLPQSQAIAQAKAKPAAQPAAQEEESKYSEEEWNALDAATKETNYEKRGTMLLEFINKWPKSELMKNVEYEYSVLLKACDDEQKWDLLKSFAEKWLALHPDSLEMYGKIAKASEKIGDFPRCAECLEEIYKAQPSGSLAMLILSTYVKANNLAKQIDWTDKLLKMTGFEGEFGLPWDLVQKYTKTDNLPKAVEWCRKTLTSADAAKQPDASAKEHLVEIRNACHLLIARSLYEAGKFGEAEKEYQKAINYKKTSQAYYHIGICLWKKPDVDVDSAMLYLAAAEIIGEEPFKKPANESLEKLYKSQHNGTTIGIDKIYKRAKEQLLSK
jgi:tetratricopeptide (TPR) repeat protein